MKNVTHSTKFLLQFRSTIQDQEIWIKENISMLMFLAFKIKTENTS